MPSAIKNALILFLLVLVQVRSWRWINFLNICLESPGHRSDNETITISIAMLENVYKIIILG